MPSPMRSPARTPSRTGPSAQALYDFEAENPGELGFKVRPSVHGCCGVDQDLVVFLAYCQVCQ